MCTVCGCENGEAQIEGQVLNLRHSNKAKHWHVHEDGTAHSHEPHEHAPAAGDIHYRKVSPHEHPQEVHVEEDSLHHDLHFGHGPAHTHVPGLTQARMVQIERDILSKNDDFAEVNRGLLAKQNVLALNFVSSPGSGKTTLLVRTIQTLSEKQNISVIEGDQQTANDAERIRATGAPAIQINTGKGCHLNAQMVGMAMDKLPLVQDSLLFIENVGNLVCPAAFDLGEAAKVAILSVTEGEDKPLKYPDMFMASSLMLLNKTDLLPYLNFDVALVKENVRRVNPNIEVIEVSSTTGEGFDEWLAWITRTHEKQQQAKPAKAFGRHRPIADVAI